ncbi:MAG: DNA internalization-related competence protein ComEC/Rec2 [Immundisolibacteraceae bacterium]|nr:DNA internalization-related competence protein ComEC/Rec2 [Immundisolibacteraceae bacterium]
MALGWLAGIAAQQQLAAPFPRGQVLVGLALTLSVCGSVWLASGAKLKLTTAGMLAFLLGLWWASWDADKVVSGTLDSALNRSRCIVQGSVEQVSLQNTKLVRFTLLASELECSLSESEVKAHPGTTRLRLTWYLPSVTVSPGQHWRFDTRLKRSHGFANPGLFDYSRWLALQGVGATGYVIDSPAPIRLGSESWSLAGFRDRLLGQLNHLLYGHAQTAIIAALALGERRQINDQQWQLIRASGTSHLLAISGLHIGLVGAFCWWLGSRVWRLQSRWLLRVPAPMVGAISGWLGALGYALLSGFAVPAQRSLIMFTVVVVSVLLRREIVSRRSYLLALVLVLAWHPMAVLQPGFWLSFGALLLIWWAVLGRLRTKPDTAMAVVGQDIGAFQAFLRHWFVYVKTAVTGVGRLAQLQFVLWLGLLPLGLFFFDQVSWVALPANLIAIPVVTLMVLPLALLGTLLMGVSETVAGTLLWLAAGLMDQLWQWLQWLVDKGQMLESLMVPVPVVGSVVVVMIAVVGGFWLTAPKGFPARWLGIGCMLPLVLMTKDFGRTFSAVQTPGQFRAQVIDVGQGLSVIVTTRNHTLVYDTGSRFSDRFDSGRDLIKPLIRRQGRSQIDELIISHGDSDHSGGLVGLLASLPVKNLCSGTVEQLLVGADISADWPKPMICASGRTWLWDGVLFEFIHQPAVAGTSDNDRSSVLRIGGDNGLLLTGDISSAAEQRLVRFLGQNSQLNKLQAEVLLVPHHGSRYSSSDFFLSLIRPELAVVSSGYANRFNHPHPLTVGRYQTAGIALVNTADQGAVTMEFDLTGLVSWQTYQSALERYWH